MLVRVIAIASLLAMFGGGALGAERVTGPGHVQLGDGTSLVLERNTLGEAPRSSKPIRESLCDSAPAHPALVLDPALAECRTGDGVSLLGRRGTAICPIGNPGLVGSFEVRGVRTLVKGRPGRKRIRTVAGRHCRSSENSKNSCHHKGQQELKHERILTTRLVR